MVYVSFSTNDLYNWKNQNAPFSEKPHELISLLETIFFTHQPTWDDCQQLLQTLFTSEKRERIKQEVGKLILGPDRKPTEADQVEHVFPSAQPSWDYNSDMGKYKLETYHQTLLGGNRRGHYTAHQSFKNSRCSAGRE